MPTIGEIYAQGVDYKVRRMDYIRQLLIAQENAAPSIRAAQWRMVQAEQQQATDLQREIEEMRQTRLKASTAVEEAWQRSTSPIQSALIRADADRDTAALRAQTDRDVAAYNATGSQARQALSAAESAYATAAKNDVVASTSTSSPEAKALTLKRIYETFDTPSTHDELWRNFNERVPALIAAGGSPTDASRAAVAARLHADEIVPLTAQQIAAKQAQAQAQDAQAMGSPAPAGGSSASAYGIPPRPAPWQLLQLGSEGDLTPYIQQAAYYRTLINQPGLLKGPGDKPLSLQEYRAVLADPTSPLHAKLKAEVEDMAHGSVTDIGTYGDPRFAELNLQAQDLAKRSQAHQSELLALDAKRTSLADMENQARTIYAGSFGDQRMKDRLVEDQAKAARLYDAMAHAPTRADANAYLTPNPLGAEAPTDATLTAEYDDFTRARTPGPVIAPEDTVRTLTPEAWAYLQDNNQLSPIPGSTTDFMANGNRVREDTTETPKPAKPPQTNSERPGTYGDTLQAAAVEEPTDKSFTEETMQWRGEDLKPKVTFDGMLADDKAYALRLAREIKQQYLDNIDDWKDGVGDSFHMSDVLQTAAFLQEMGVPEDDSFELPNWSVIAKYLKSLESGDVEDPTSEDKGPTSQQKIPSPESQSELESIAAATTGMQIASVSKATQTDPLQELKRRDGKVILSKKEISLLSDLASRANQPTGKELTQALMGVTGSSRWLNDLIRDQAKTYYASLLSLKKGE